MNEKAISELENEREIFNTKITNDMLSMKLLIPKENHKEMPDHSGLTEEIFETFAARVKTLYFNSVVDIPNDKTTDKEALKNTPQKFIDQLDEILKLLKETKERRVKKKYFVENNRWEIPLKKIQPIYSEKHPIKTHENLLDFIGMSSEKEEKSDKKSRSEKNIELTKKEDKKQKKISSKSNETNTLQPKSKHQSQYEELENKITEKKNKLENQIKINQYLRNTLQNLYEILQINLLIILKKTRNFTEKIDVLIQDFNNLPPKENYPKEMIKVQTYEKLIQLIQKYDTYQQQIDILFQESKLIKNEKNNPIDFSGKFSGLNLAKKQCQERLSLTVVEILNELKEKLILSQEKNQESVHENKNIILEVKHAYETLSKGESIKFINLNENTKQANILLKTKIEECEKQNLQIEIEIPQKRSFFKKEERKSNKTNKEIKIEHQPKQTSKEDLNTNSTQSNQDHKSSKVQQKKENESTAFEIDTHIISKDNERIDSKQEPLLPVNTLSYEGVHYNIKRMADMVSTFTKNTFDECRKPEHSYEAQIKQDTRFFKPHKRRAGQIQRLHDAAEALLTVYQEKGGKEAIIKAGKQLMDCVFKEKKTISREWYNRRKSSLLINLEKVVFMSTITPKDIKDKAGVLKETNTYQQLMFREKIEGYSKLDTIEEENMEEIESLRI